MNLQNNPFSTPEELEDRVEEAFSAGERAQPMPDATKEHLILSQEYLKGLKDHMTGLHIARDIEGVDIPDADFEAGRALIRETENFISDMQTAREYEQHRDFYRRLGLESPEPKQESPADTFVVSIDCEYWKPEDLEAGQSSWTDTKVEREAVDAETLQRLAQDHGLDSPSASDPRQSPTLWFSSSTPREDRAYFEQGVHKYYSLHIHEVNGHPPQPAEYQRVSDLIGARFDHPLERHEATHEMDGPDF